jgi:hypothetical protein
MLTHAEQDDSERAASMVERQIKEAQKLLKEKVCMLTHADVC